MYCLGLSVNRAWQQLGYRGAKGEKGIRIYAPPRLYPRGCRSTRGTTAHYVTAILL